MAEPETEGMIDVTDPYQTPVIFVSQVVGTGFLNGVVNLTLATARFTPSGGRVEPDLVVSSRLRMDLFCAQQLRNEIDRIILQNTKANPAVN